MDKFNIGDIVVCTCDINQIKTKDKFGIVRNIFGSGRVGIEFLSELKTHSGYTRKSDLRGMAKGYNALGVPPENLKNALDVHQIEQRVRRRVRQELAEKKKRTL